MNIELVPYNECSKEDLIRICNGVDRRYLANRLPYPYTEKDAETWMNTVMEHEGADGVFRVIKIDVRAAGNISVEQKKDVYTRDEKIGYMLMPEYWSHGIMTEAVRLMCDLAFKQLNIIRITGYVYAPNIASIKVLQKNGFSREGVMRNAVTKDYKVYDLCIYGLLKS